MDSNKIKILNLNIHNYHDFIQRKPKIVNLIRKYAPDIVTLQEIRDNRAKNEEGIDQAKKINEELGFEHYTFLRVNDINKAKNLVDIPSCYEGLAILSRFPFSHKELLLKRQKNDKYYRKVLIANVQIENQVVPIWVVHFSNNDLFAKLHAEETLSYVKDLQPIIIGDFNIKFPKEIEELAQKNNFVSSSKYEYISFPQDNCSYDYIFIPKKFTFLDFECVSEEVSDHKALVAEIKL